MKVPLGRKWAQVALLLVTQKAPSSSWAHFFLKLKTRQVGRISNYSCSLWHPALLILLPEQGTRGLGRQCCVPLGCLRLPPGSRHGGFALLALSQQDVSRTLMLLLRGFQVVKYIFNFVCLHLYVYIYTLCIYTHKIMWLLVI